MIVTDYGMVSDIDISYPFFWWGFCIKVYYGLESKYTKVLCILSVYRLRFVYNLLFSLLVGLNALDAQAELA